MKKTKFQRIIALILAVVFLTCGGAIATGAESASDAPGKTTAEIKELLNAISYNEYIGQVGDHVLEADKELIINAYENVTYKAADGTVSVPAVREMLDVDDEDYDKDVVQNYAYVGEFDGKTALYTPSSGTLTWDITSLVADDTMYSLEIEYYPVKNKSASIERILKINNSVPFAEARSLSFSKIWKNVYEDGKFAVPEDESYEDYIKAGEAAGIACEHEVIDGVDYVVYTMPDYWTENAANVVNDQMLRFFTADIDKNEIRSSLMQTPAWSTYIFKDSNGFMQNSFKIVVGPDEDTGKTEISLESVNEPMAIASIRLVPYDEPMSYDEYKDIYASKGYGTDKIKIEGEYYSAVSSQTIYPISDTTSAVNSPAATDRTVLNAVGGDKWQSAGQWIEYKFKVENSGLYTIATRFKQSVLDGMYTSRIMHIYSDSTLEEGDDGYYNGIPFAEAAKLQFNYASDWQSGLLTDGVDSFDIYFEEGVEYTLRFEVSLGNMGDIVRRVQESLDSINDDYLNILKLTGTSPDEYRDYGFSRVMPDTMIDMIKQSKILGPVNDEKTGIMGVAYELNEAAGVKSSMTATLEKVSRLLETMGKDDDEVAKNLEQLKTYIGSLGTWLSDAKTQPLTLDYIVIQPADDAELPVAKAGFFKALGYEIVSFIRSFFRNYSRMGAMTETKDTDAVEVWLAYGRDQSQVIRSLINNDFTPATDITIDLKLVSGGTLLPSILSGMGPDAYIGIGQNEVINYAIRGALIEIEDMSGFDEAVKDFDESAMLVLGIENAEGEMHYYGLPETQNFTMMFVREDIFAELDLEIPRTWDDVKEIIPVLQSNNMQIGMTKDENIFLYQMGGDLFADDGMRINLDSNVALEAFNTMCEMFTMYSFPYKYDFPNRFRTGEMPIGFATYTATYNQLKVFATEIEGLWSFYPLPGYMNEDGSISNESVSTVSAISIITDCEDVESTWEFVKWHADDQCQIDYANEMVALLGPSAKHPTANISALESLPWTDAELEQLFAQFDKLAAIPNYPGRYIVERYTQFAFLDAFNNKADPVTEMQSYIKTINTEITRKRQEFGLEVLADGQTLAQKRMLEAETKLLELEENGKITSEYESAYNNALKLMEKYTTEDFASLRALADDFEELNAELFAEVAADMRSAAKALERYEAYK